MGWTASRLARYSSRMVGLAVIAGCWFTDEEVLGALALGQDGCGSGARDNGDAPEYSEANGIQLIGIPSGTFCMGSEARGSDSVVQPTHSVSLTRPLWMGRTEITQAEYEEATGERPSYHAGCDDCPVENVSWYEAALFANLVSAAEGLEQCYSGFAEPEPAGDQYACDGFRLPTEAEWEYAAKAGTELAYSGSTEVSAVAWTEENSGGYTHPSDSLSPNAWGLYDMSGNVWEWTGDWYDSEYYSASPSKDPDGPIEGSLRVNRGGSWGESGDAALASVRRGSLPDDLGIYLGLRLARTAP